MVTMISTSTLPSISFIRVFKLFNKDFKSKKIDYESKELKKYSPHNSRLTESYKNNMVKYIPLYTLLNPIK